MDMVTVSLGLGSEFHGLWLYMFGVMVMVRVNTSQYINPDPLSHPGTRPPVLWTGKLQGWTGIPVQQLVVDG